ncbi:hypothetical protein [Neorhizobium sp. DT-125]
MVAWSAVWWVLYMFRPVVMLCGVAAIMSMPISIVVWFHPDSPNGLLF